MFRHRFQAVPTMTPPVEPVEGIIFCVEQQSLKFGSNRKVPVRTRPVLPWRRRDNYAVVLPATSKQTNSSDFFPLDEKEVEWVHENSKQTFIYCQYETIQTVNLESKLAVISQNARMNIAHWLRRKYG